MLSYHQTPIESILDPACLAAGVELYVQREDLNHGAVSGNKWWKLKYNLEEAASQQHHTLLTFGGAYSNHIYATAAAAKEMGMRSIGIIRGEEQNPLNDTLTFAAQSGMQLHYISREGYRNKDERSYQDELRARFGKVYIIPEGGSNELGVAGVAAFGETLPSGFDYVCCAIGTGATLAGLVRARRGNGSLIGIPVLKGGDSWRDEVERFNPGYANWSLATEYHFGGYAKSNNALELFTRAFSSAHRIPLEHVYTAKVFYAVMDLIAKGSFKRGSKILVIHTGGIR